MRSESDHRAAGRLIELHGTELLRLHPHKGAALGSGGFFGIWGVLVPRGSGLFTETLLGLCDANGGRQLWGWDLAVIQFLARKINSLQLCIQQCSIYV